VKQILSLIICLILGLQGVTDTHVDGIDQLVFTSRLYSTDDVSSWAMYRYDSIGNETVTLHQSENQILFKLSSKGIVAFSEVSFPSTGSPEIYLLDINDLTKPVINLSQQINLDGYPLGWGSGGQYLALSVPTENEGSLLYIWDGENVINITPEDLSGTPVGYDVAWSSDGRLAFTVWFGFSSDSPPPEIYLWDGFSTVNISKNPSREDRYIAWSPDNQLAYLSSLDGGYRIVIWDDNTTTMSNIVQYQSAPSWTPTGDIAFGLQTPEDTHTQIYLWDGEQTLNISNNPSAHNGGITWANNGQWAFVTYFSSEQMIYVRDENNQTLLAVNGQYTPAWGDMGYLAFCSAGWKLSIWNGTKVIEIERATEIQAQWQSGQSTFCSSG